MSAQFGRWNFDSQASSFDYVEKVSATLAPYGPDSAGSYSKNGVEILYHSLRTTKESHRETQPHVSLSGVVIAWDGRVDNRTELIIELRESVTANSTDVEIVAAAFERWGEQCLSRLIGDWALSVWDPGDRSLILAKDPVGSRNLYYTIDKDEVIWSTILDPIVLFARKTFAICEEYVAGWLARFPAAHLTPYVGIHAVPPSSSVTLRPGKNIVRKYWDFDPSKRLRYRSDAEYEEHFRSVLFKAVERRLRSDRPVLAELSGGMDSSSVVCVADLLIARSFAGASRLDTISWYDDSDPNWDDHLYFPIVEAKRGRSGWHIDLGAGKRREVGRQREPKPEFENARFAVTPVASSSLPPLFNEYVEHMNSRGYRVVLCGLGGDSVTGSGVPTPTPELQDLLVTARFCKLSHQLRAWAAKMGKSPIPLLWEAVRGFLPLALAGSPKDMRSAPWLQPGFVRRNHIALCCYPSSISLFGGLPSFQRNVSNLAGERRLMASGYPGSELLRELRCPYLDRDFLEFMYSVPREQVVRVGQRRSLMRRALFDLVPAEILNRRRKPTLIQPPPADNWAELASRAAQLGNYMVSASMGIVNRKRFSEALQKAEHNEEVSLSSLRRTLTLESWLRHLTNRGVLTNSNAQEEACLRPDVWGNGRSSPAQPKSSAS
jgi:asparagine synthase (glutamine-hydrolysing)